MNNYEMSKEEKEYLSAYDITQFERPSVAADMAVFSVMGELSANGERRVRDSANFRKLPEKKLKVLLIKRGTYPYKDCWALPGGFCRKQEDVYETAKRELYEETHVENAYLQFAGIFGDRGRDPRGWIISNTFLALMDGEKCELRAGTDAWEARWFDISLEKKEIKREQEKDAVISEYEYTLLLKNTDLKATNIREDADLPDKQKKTEELKAVIRQDKEFRNYHETVRYEIVESQGFAFDHAKIITYALLSLREQAQKDGKIVFDLMPEKFTLTELQKAFEIVLDKKLLVANFRRKMAGYVIETEESIEGAGHRPAKLFKRNVEAFS